MDERWEKEMAGNDLNGLRVGTIIKSKRWKELVEIKKIEQIGNYIHIIGSTTESNYYIDQLIPLSEFRSLSIEQIESNFQGDPKKVFLAFETKRYRYASLYDPLLAINVSKVDPLPHQIEAVYGFILKLPRIRFLIADDPGAGKTIMAGLIIKELKLSNRIQRVLIVVPGHLKDQWRRELKERFEEKFVVIDRGFLGAHFGENVWQKENQVITSIDFLKRDTIVPSISSVHFDLVIIDEAHKMSAYRYGDQTHKTGRYKLGEILSKNSEHLIFLTATPHRGDPENFRLFLDLLEPGFFATTEMLQESIRNKDNPLFIRRVKEDLKNFNGEPIFLPRYVKTLKFRLSNPEKLLYNDVSRYVKEQYNKALIKDKRRNIAFALVILQRRLTSSTFALLKSLENRKLKLEDLIKEAEISFATPIRKIDFETIEDLSEGERWKEEELWETLSVAENREELKREIQTLDRLIAKAGEIIQREEEVKLKELRKTLVSLLKKEPNNKIIIFTESRKTLEYLEKRAANWGYSVCVIHGGMSLEGRIESEKIFKNVKQLLIATEAAGEGINLQFCNLMINYDIPWNPNRLEQRMGRIHRYGQQREVFIFNLVAQDTREGAVLIRIFDKLEEIKKSLGKDRVFDVVGEIFLGKNLEQLIIEAAAGAKSRKEVLKEIEITVDEAYITQIKENLAESLATKYIDYTRIKELAEKAKEHRLIPEYTEAFFKKSFSLLGGKFRERKDELLGIASIPYKLKIIASEEKFKRNFGSLLKAYLRVTFDKDIAFSNPDTELVTFGHPLFEALLEHNERNFSDDLKKGAVFIDPKREFDGYIIFYEGEIKDGTAEPFNVVGKRLFAIFTNENEIRSIFPTILWDLIEGKNEEEKINVRQLKQKVMTTVISEMEAYKTHKLAIREKEAKIKEKYGIKSLNYLIVGLDGDLIDLYSRKEKGENVALAIRNKEERKRRYEQALVELSDDIVREKTLTMQLPKFLGIIRVKPSKKVYDFMRSDKQVEEIGMTVAMHHEKSHNRVPLDVSAENVGFDIRSADEKGHIRYIEVKARAGVGSVVLTQNEWFKAKRFNEDYYLYIVLNAVKNPELFRIRNPANSIKTEEIVELVRYLIPKDQIQDKGIKNE